MGRTRRAEQACWRRNRLLSVQDQPHDHGLTPPAIKRRPVRSKRPASSASQRQKDDRHTVAQRTVPGEDLLAFEIKTAAAICQRPTGHDNVLRDEKKPPAPVVLLY